MFFDTHVHTNCSPDSSARLKDIIDCGAKNGVGLLCITDHCDLEKPQWREYLDRIEQSYENVVQLRDYAKSKNIELLAGVELGQTVLDYDISKSVVDALPFDFVLAAQHCAADNTDFYFMPTERFKAEGETFIAEYLQAQKKTASLKLADSLAHLTYPERYFSLHGLSANFDNHLTAIEEVFCELIKNEMALEINTSGIRKGYRDLMPYDSLLKLYYDLGGRLITIGSDSHEAQDVGSGFSVAIDTLKSIGFKSAFYFKNRKPVEYSL